MIIDLCKPLNEGEELTVRTVMSLSEARQIIADNGYLKPTDFTALRIAVDAGNMCRRVDELLNLMKKHGVTVDHELVEQLRHKFDASALETGHKPDVSPLAQALPVVTVTPNYTVVAQAWVEHEAGWGARPDGASLHLTEANRVAFCKACWDREKLRNPSGIAPTEYTCEYGLPQMVQVDEAMYERVRKSDGGLWSSRS